MNTSVSRYVVFIVQPIEETSELKGFEEFITKRKDEEKNSRVK